MFITAIEKFGYSPLVVNGEIVRGKIELQNTLMWFSDEQHNYIVPNKFICDLASLPISGLLFKKLGRHQRAAVLHDYLYRNKINSKRWADRQFRQAMACDGVAPWRKWLIWAGVAVFGWRAWWRTAP